MSKNKRSLEDTESLNKDYKYILDNDGQWHRIGADDITRTFEQLVVTPKGNKYNFVPKYIDNSEKAAELRDKMLSRQYTKGFVGEPGLELIHPEFDILSLSSIIKKGSLLRGTKNVSNKGKAKIINNTITEENASKITPAQWTTAQDAAIARGDIAEAQRLRDLHFKVSAPDTKVDIPLWSSSEKHFNSFDLSHFGETDNGFFGYGHYLTPIEKYAATYHPVNRKFYVNVKNPYIGDNDQYFNRIQYVKDRLARRKENVIRNLHDGKLTKFSKKLGINESTSLEDAEHLVDKYIADETVKWNNKYVKYVDEFEGKDGVLSWRDLQGIPNKREGIYKEVVIPRGEQIKSADAVTYDDKGIRIPLGKRDNFKLNDIRYSFMPFIIGGTGYGIYNK